jgi:hypothetical protein
MRLRRYAKPAEPLTYCKVCWVKWGRALTENCCLCNGKVSRVFQCPGKLGRDIDPSQLPKDLPRKPKKKDKSLAS